MKSTIDNVVEMIEPWYGNPDGTVKEPDYGKIMVWGAGYRRRTWQKYYRTALARMEEWQDGQT